MTNWVRELKYGWTALIIIAVVCLSVSKAVPPKSNVGAMIRSKFASADANAFSTIYWEESTRNKKSERKKVCSTDGYEYYFSKSSKSSYYVCKNNKGRSCKCREHSSGKLTDCPCQCRPPCSGTLVVHPNGKVVNNVKHVCKPDEKVIRSGQEILVERRSRQSEESGCSFSISKPCSATSPTLPMARQLLQLLSDPMRETATSHTQHDNPNLDMQQGGLPLEQQSSLPGESGAFHAERGREQGDQLLDYNYLLQFSSTGSMKHICKPDENVIRSGQEILDERRSRQSEESGCSSSISKPCSAISPTLPMEQLLQLLFDPTRETATSHTQHDNPSNLDMQQGSRLLEQQSSFPGESAAFHAERGREQGDELPDCLLQLCSPGEMNCQETDASMCDLCASNDAGYDFGCEISSESSKPEFIINPRNVLAMPGSTVTFSTETRGVNVTYAWKHDGKYMNGEDREYLIILQASVRNEGKYECVASNKYGMVSSEYAYLKLKSEKDFFQERTMIPQSIDPILSFQYYPILVDDRNLDQSDQDVDFGAYNIVSTEAKDTGNTSQLVTGLIQLLVSKNQLDSQLQKREDDSHTSSSPSSVASGPGHSMMVSGEFELMSTRVLI